MADILEAVFDPGVGLSFNTLIVRAYNESANGKTTSVGQLACLNIPTATYGMTGITGSYVEGSPGYHLAHHTDGGTVPNRDGIWGICLDGGVTSAGIARYLVKGVVTARVWDQTSTNTSPGDRMVVTPTSFNINASGVGATAVPRKAVAIALEAANTSVGDANNGVLMKVLFDGVNGFGGSNDD